MVSHSKQSWYKTKFSCRSILVFYSLLGKKLQKLVEVSFTTLRTTSQCWCFVLRDWLWLMHVVRFIMLNWHKWDSRQKQPTITMSIKKYILLGKHFYTGNSLILWKKYRSFNHRKVCCVLQMELFCYMQRVLRY